MGPGRLLQLLGGPAGPGTVLASPTMPELGCVGFGQQDGAAGPLAGAVALGPVSADRRDVVCAPGPHLGGGSGTRCSEGPPAPHRMEASAAACWVVGLKSRGSEALTLAGRALAPVAGSPCALGKRELPFRAAEMGWSTQRSIVSLVLVDRTSISGRQRAQLHSKGVDSSEPLRRYSPLS